MPFNGSGSYSPPGADFPAVSGTIISSTKFNNIVNDISTGLSNAVTRDGQSAFLANIPAGGFKITGLGAPSTTNDALAWGQHASVDRLTVTGSTVPANGVYLPAANTIGFSTNSTQRLNINSTGATTITAASGVGLTINGATATNALFLSDATTQFAVLLNGASGTALNTVTNHPMELRTNNTARLTIAAAGGITIPGTLTLTNVVVSGTGRTFTADMDNATLNSRFAFQTSTVNAATSVEAIPNGSSTTAQFAAWSGASRTDQSVGILSAAATSVSLLSLKTGTGTVLPLDLGVSSAQWRIDITGRWLNTGNTQSTFRGYSSASRTTAGVFATYTEEYDTGSWFNNTTGVATVPVTGTYLITASVVLSAAGTLTAIACNIRKNGTAINGGLFGQKAESNVLQTSVGHVVVVSLTAGDTLDIELSSITGTSASATCNNFTAALIR
jgi:hypothetical protein